MRIRLEFKGLFFLFLLILQPGKILLQEASTDEVPQETTATTETIGGKVIKKLIVLNN